MEETWNPNPEDSTPADNTVPESEIETMLNDLYSDSAKRRWATINKIAEKKIIDERINSRLQTMAAQDAMPYVREAASAALSTLGVASANLATVTNTPSQTAPAAASVTPSGSKANTFKFSTIILLILGLITPLWPISLPFFWFLAYRTYKSDS